MRGRRVLAGPVCRRAPTWVALVPGVARGRGATRALRQQPRWTPGHPHLFPLPAPRVSALT